MTSDIKVKEFVKARATDVDFGIFRARVVDDVVEGITTVEFGSRGGWDEDGGTIILSRNEFTDIMQVLRKAEELMNSIPDDEFDDDDSFEEDDEFEEDIDEDELDEEWEDEE